MLWENGLPATGEAIPRYSIPHLHPKGVLL